MRRLPMILTIAGLVILMSCYARAELIEFEFGGEVTYIWFHNFTPAPWDSVNIGDSWSIKYTFDSATPPQYWPPWYANYWSAIKAYELQMGDVHSESSSPDDSLIEVTDNGWSSVYPDGYDAYRVSIYFPDPCWRITWRIDLEGPTTSWDGLALPLCGDINLSSLTSCTFHLWIVGEDWWEFMEISGSVNYHTCKHPPVASFTYSPEKPMVGEEITFDASSSYDPDGTIVKYEWDFGDGNIKEGQIASHVFTDLINPGSYTVTLTVTDNDGLTGSTSKIIEIPSLIPGDLLLGYGTKIVPGYWSHIGMYIGNEQVVESHISYTNSGIGGVDITSLEEWFERYRTWAALRVVSTDDEIREEAINWATDPSRRDDPYDLMWWQKDANGEAWYCSELVWAAYLHASNGQINIEYGPDITGITPDEIVLDDDTELIAINYEDVSRKGVIIITKSPVDLEVIDPENLTANKWLNEIPGAIYGEDDLDGDGDLEDWIGIPERKIGKYLISVIPEPEALPTETYTLEIATDEEAITLAENVQIANIPAQPYIIRSTLTEIIPIIPATIDFGPDTLNLKSQGEWITVYIELPAGHGYDVGDIDVGSILLEYLLEVQQSDIQDSVLMVKFYRQDVIAYIEVVLGFFPPEDVTFTVMGELKDGTRFEGTDTIRVIDKD